MEIKAEFHLCQLLANTCIILHYYNSIIAIIIIISIIISLVITFDHKKVKLSHTSYRALGPELIPVYRQSAGR